MLENAGIPVESAPADIDERAIEAQSGAADPARVATLLAREKAKHVAAAKAGRIVLGADQVLTCEGRRLSKPRDIAAGRDQLRYLSGRTHELTSSSAVVRDGTILFDTADVAHLTMRAFSASFLDSYVETVGSALTASVGGYQLESVGLQLFERIAGDYFTILGLPMLPLLAFFRRQGWLAS